MIEAPPVTPSSYTLSTAEIIEEACSIAGIASEGEPVSAYIAKQAMRSLNIMLRAWGAEDHLWLRTEVDLPTAAGVNSYLITPRAMRIDNVRRADARAAVFALPPDAAGATVLSPVAAAAQGLPLDVDGAASIVDGVITTHQGATVALQEGGGDHVTSYLAEFSDDTIETPLTRYARETYMAMSMKGAVGQPVAFYFDAQAGQSIIYLWPTPAAPGAIRFTAQRTIADMLETSDLPDLPVEWLAALSYGLADQLAVKFVANAQLRQEISARASAARTLIDSWDAEDASLFMQPDMRW